MKKQVWVSEDGGFIGATGVNNEHEFAELIANDANLLDYLDILAPDSELFTVEEIEKALIDNQVHAILISIAYFYSDTDHWDSSKTYSVPLDAIPDRGWMKVLGVNI